MGHVTLDSHEVRPVFVTAGRRRARALRGLGYLTGTLTVLWLVALIAGAVGVGRLPAVPFPALGAVGEAPATSAGPHAAPAPSVRHALPSGGILERTPASRAGRDRSGQDPLTRLTSPVVTPRRTGRDVGSRRPRGGSSLPVGSAPGSGAAQQQPGATQPVAPAAPTPPRQGSAPGTSGDHPPAGGRSAAPPASRPVDPPAGGVSDTPPATRPVGPPPAAPDTAHSPSTD